MRTRRLYRATAHYADGTTARRHFQTARARDGWAANRREGYPERATEGWDDGEPLPAIEPATRVDVEDSWPVLFPSEANVPGSPNLP